MVRSASSRVSNHEATGERKHAFAFSPRDAPELCVKPSALGGAALPKGERATPRGERGMPGARCTRSLVCKGRKHTS
jgi:hypothetical protein